MSREDAVSPVVGVMLMLTVTVIIAAVVAATASGFAADVVSEPSYSPAEIVYAGSTDAFYLFQMNSGSPIETAHIQAVFTNKTGAVKKVISGITSTGNHSFFIGERLAVPKEAGFDAVFFELYRAETGFLLASGEIPSP